MLPVLWDKAFETLKRRTEETRPDEIIMFGQAGGAQGIRIELLGKNIRSYIKDNGGHYPDGVLCAEKSGKICDTGDDEYRSTFEYERIFDAVSRTGIPVRYSESAGAYICNELLYRTLREIYIHDKKIKAGFIHLPYLTAQNKTGKYSIDAEQLDNVISAVIGAVSE